MNSTEKPRLLARIAGAFYLVITAFALFAYMYVRGQLIVPGDMAQTASNVQAHEQFYRMAALPEIPHILLVPLIGEGSLFLWLVVIGLNEEKWHAQAAASTS